MSEEIDLLQGRVPRSVFARHYLKENLDELKGKILESTTNLEKSLLNPLSVS